MTDELKKIEETLGVQFEEFSYKKKNAANSYEYYGDTIRRLVITGCVFDLQVLLPLSKEVRHLRLVNCTIDSLAGFSHFEALYELNLNNVTITHGKKASGPVFHTIPAGDMRLQVNLDNMHLQYPAELLSLNGGLDHLFVRNCTISNFYEINLLPNLYDLRLTSVTIRQSDDDIVHEPLPDRNFIRICLDEMILDSLDVFVPISENVHNLQIENSTIHSIRNIHRFAALSKFEIDAATKITDTATETDPVTDFWIDECFISEKDRYGNDLEPKAAFDLLQLRSVAHYIRCLNFQGYASCNAGFLQHFSRLETLEFKFCSVPLSDFLPVAHQVKKIVFEASQLNQHEYFSHFTQLEAIATWNYGDNPGIEDLKKLLPLKNHLKEMDITDSDMINTEAIHEFISLENLDISVRSAEAAQSVLSLGSLKKLHLGIHLEPEPAEPFVFDVSVLKNLQELEVSADHITVTGIEHLTQLKTLKLYCDCVIGNLQPLKKLEYLEFTAGKNADINAFSGMESLRTLVLSCEEGYEVHSLEQFPNLEKLKIEGAAVVNPGRLEKLKILIPEQINLETATWLNNLPDLEQLGLEHAGITTIKNLDKLTKLKMLDLSENEIDSLHGLENLVSLEHLNLYENKVSDVTVLNQLPNLKEVNLGRNEMERHEARAQLKNPEVVRFIYPPYVPFRVRIRD